MDAHNNNDDDDHRAPTITNKSHRRYTNVLSRFCNWLAQQPSHRHMTRHNNNGEIVLIYNRVDAAIVDAYLHRRLGRPPSMDTARSFYVAIRWGSRQAGESLSIGCYDIISNCCISLQSRLVIIRKKVCFGFLRLAVLLVRARKRANHRLYSPGGAGYERCREEFYSYASISN